MTTFNQARDSLQSYTKTMRERKRPGDAQDPFFWAAFRGAESSTLWVLSQGATEALRASVKDNPETLGLGDLTEAAYTANVPSRSGWMLFDSALMMYRTHPRERLPLVGLFWFRNQSGHLVVFPLLEVRGDVVVFDFFQGIRALGQDPQDALLGYTILRRLVEMLEHRDLMSEKKTVPVRGARKKNWHYQEVTALDALFEDQDQDAAMGA